MKRISISLTPAFRPVYLAGSNRRAVFNGFARFEAVETAFVE